MPTLPAGMNIAVVDEGSHAGLGHLLVLLEATVADPERDAAPDDRRSTLGAWRRSRRSASPSPPAASASRGTALLRQSPCSRPVARRSPSWPASAFRSTPRHCSPWAAAQPRSTRLSRRARERPTLSGERPRTRRRRPGDRNGIVGVVVPVLPGALLAWAAIAVWALVVGSATGWAVLAVATLLIGGAQVVKVLVPGRRLRDAGSPANRSPRGSCSPSSGSS